MGTPGFAVEPLRVLIERGHDVAAVVTSPDRPAGRGMSLRASEVKRFAVDCSLPVMQPVRLRDAGFIDELRSFNADLFVVVAFRMLPEVVWAMPACGTVNLHASLLPQYRGAAPINHALINGEQRSGVTTFFISHEIDTGRLLLQRELSIGVDETAGALHDRLMTAGADLLEETVRRIAAGDVCSYPQPAAAVLKSAPKLSKESGRINWLATGESIRNLVRGLSPYPAAWGELEADGSQSLIPVKIFNTCVEQADHGLAPGTICSDGRTFLKVACSDGFVHVLELQPAGKKAMAVTAFLAGFRRVGEYRFRGI